MAHAMLRWGLVGALALSGCFVKPPDSNGGLPSSDGGPSDAGAEPSGPPPFDVSPVPATTVWLTSPVHGHGPAGGIVLVTGGANGTQTGPIQSTGQFCVDVPLTANTLHTIALRAQDTGGVLSDPIQVQIQQSGSPPPPPTAKPSQNVAIGALVNHSGALSSISQPSYLNDGNYQTYFGFASRWPFETMWVSVDLPASSNLSRVHVHFGTNCMTKQYAVLASNYDVPGDCKTGVAQWITVGAVTNGTGDDDIALTAVQASHVCLLLSGAGCNPIPSMASFDVGELEAWTVANVPPPAPHAPTCAGGG